MPEPFISVILPTRDRAAWLDRAIRSVLDQTHAALELIVVDDGSQDRTAHVLERHAGRITVLRQAGAGAYAARNLGVRHAQADLIAFMDSDDAWRPHRLASQVRRLDRPEVGLVFGDQALIRPDAVSSRGLTSFGVTPPRRGRVAEHFVWGNFVPTPTVLARRSCLEEVGGFPTSSPSSGDYLTWFRIALRHELDFVPEVVVDYTVHPEGISFDLARSLEARVELFADELSRTEDAATRRTLQRLLVVLGVHLAVARLRGRDGDPGPSWRLAQECLSAAPVRDRLPTIAQLLARQAYARARRTFTARR